MKRLINVAAALLFIACHPQDNKKAIIETKQDTLSFHQLAKDPANKRFIELLSTRGIPFEHPTDPNIQSIKASYTVYKKQIKPLLDQYRFRLFTSFSNNTANVVIYGQGPDTPPELLLGN